MQMALVDALVYDGHMTPRSYLFVPADRPERIAKALASGADAVIVDLEDAVAPEAKSGARQSLVAWLEDQACVTARAATASPDGGVAGHLPVPLPTPLFVRTNSAGTPWFQDDLQVCSLPGVHGIVLPRAQTLDELATVQAAAPQRVLLPLIETALGMQAAVTLASAPGVQRLVFGSLDLQADLGIEADDEGEEEALLAFRSHLVLASRLGGLAAPVDGVSTALQDEAVVQRDTVRARRLGFGAKLCIHPKQVTAVHRGFAPSAEDVAWARRVLKVYEAAQQAGGHGAVAVDGKMVDAPVLRRAHTVLERSARA
jgi:citrate lyase subunit beta/citryl-CoA lyase